jgi:hypothetical protein
VCTEYNLNTLTFNEKRINYYNNFVFVGKTILKRIINMISETDDTIDSDIDQSRHIMLDMISKIDKLNDDDENYSLKSPEDGFIENM